MVKGLAYNVPVTFSVHESNEPETVRLLVVVRERTLALCMPDIVMDLLLSFADIEFVERDAPVVDVLFGINFENVPVPEDNILKVELLVNTSAFVAELSVMLISTPGTENVSRCPPVKLPRVN